MSSPSPGIPRNSRNFFFPSPSINPFPELNFPYGSARPWELGKRLGISGYSHGGVGNGNGELGNGSIPFLELRHSREKARREISGGNRGISGAGSARIVDPTPGPARDIPKFPPCPRERFPSVPGALENSGMSPFPGKLFRSPTPSGSGISSQNPRLDQLQPFHGVGSPQIPGFGRHPDFRALIPGFPDASSKEFFPA